MFLYLFAGLTLLGMFPIAIDILSTLFPNYISRTEQTHSKTSLLFIGLILFFIFGSLYLWATVFFPAYLIMYPEKSFRHQMHVIFVIFVGMNTILHYGYCIIKGPGFKSIDLVFFL